MLCLDIVNYIQIFYVLGNVAVCKINVKTIVMERLLYKLLLALYYLSFPKILCLLTVKAITVKHFF